MQNVKKIGIYALGGLACAALAPASSAQGIRHLTFTTTADSLTSDTLFLPQFNASDPRFHDKPVILLGADVSTVANMSVYGTATNNGTTTQGFLFKQDVVWTLTGPSFTSTTEPVYTANVKKAPFGPLPPGGTFTYGTASAPIVRTGLGDTGFITSNLTPYQGTGNVSLSYTSANYAGVSGASNIAVSSNVASQDITAKVTYYFFLGPTSVPELGTSISLGLMGLVGGAFGLRSRLRSKRK